MNGRIGCFFAIVRFRWMYHTRVQKAWRYICLFTFLVSAFELVRGLLVINTVSWGPLLYSLLVAVVAFVSLSKDVLSLFPKSEMRERLIRYRDREDKHCREALNSVVLHVGPSKTEDEYGFTKIEFPHDSDFVLVSRCVDSFLRHGGKIWCQARNFQDTLMWRRLNRRLNEASRLLALKQKADDYAGFFNEDKVMMVSSLQPKPTTLATTLEIAKTCYYASYLSNEFYRDSVMDEDGETKCEGVDGVWSPFEGDGSAYVLHELRGGVSAHVGVNTIGVTRDGYVLIWMQGSGQHSFNQAAPTGSGSMDWEDLKDSHPIRDDAGRILFNDVITYAAERELLEESFSGCHVEGLSTRIIGYFRWGRRGGLPGFVCLTKLPISKDDLTIKNNEVCRCKGLEKLRLCGSNEEMIAALDAYEKYCDKEVKMSIPLIVCLRCLRDLLSSEEPDVF